MADPKASKRGAKKGAVNPTSAPDPRFDPASNDENAAAHGTKVKKATTKDDASDTQIVVRRLLNEAIDYYEQELEPDQTKATDYFYGRPFGDEKKGRSKVVNTVLRNAVLSTIPSLMRIVYQDERVVEYKARELEDEPGAEQATDTIRHVITVENPGFRIFEDNLMDGLVRRLGIFKWWWDEDVRSEQIEFTGLSQAEFAQIVNDDKIEVDLDAHYVDADSQPSYDVTVTRTEEPRSRYETLPNEEFVFTPNARSLEKAMLVAHVREVPAPELEAMGIDADLIEESKGQQRRLLNETLDAARQFDGLSTRYIRSETDKASENCLYAEAYVLRPKKKGAGMERRLFKCVGPMFEITNGDNGELADNLPFSVWTPVPEPHTVVGQSFYDLLRNPQRIISQIERGTLDSLAQAITPVTEVVQGQVNMQDFISPEIAGVRRVRQIGMTNNIVHHFVGGDTLPVLDYYNGVVEDITGRNRGAMALDADALQSTTKLAAASILSASQQSMEMLARNFCEMALKPLCEGLLKLETQHRNRKRTIRLRNQYVEVDPRSWDSLMDVQINVALGAGTPADKLEMLAGLAGKQQELLASGSPLVSNIELRKTLAKMTTLSGERNVAEFWKPWGPQEEQQLQQAMAQQPPPPDPNMALVEIERLKVASDAALKEKQFGLDQWKAQQENDRERDKISRDMAMQELEIEKKYQTTIDQAKLEQEIERDRMAQEGALKQAEIAAKTSPRRIEIGRAPAA